MAVEGVIDWDIMFAAEYIRSTGVVSGVIGRLIEDCLQRIKTLCKLVSTARTKAVNDTHSFSSIDR